MAAMEIGFAACFSRSDCDAKLEIRHGIHSQGGMWKPYLVSFSRQRGKGFCKLRYNLMKRSPRCEFSPDSANIEIMSSSISALELLKTSAADRYTRESSSIVAIGLNYRTAPIEIREKLSIEEAQWPNVITELCDLNHIEEAAVLSTCNRMEIYVVALSQHRGVKEVTEWMSKRSSVPVSELCKHRFILYNKDATQHLFEVASGLDSLVLGEGQILSQVKQVVKTGQGVSGFDRKIGGLFKQAITVGKRVRTETSISTGSVSVSSAAVELALMKLPEAAHELPKILVIGAGKMGKLVIKHLVSKGCRNIVVVNRTEDRVASIREELKDVEIEYRPLSEMHLSAAESDVIFACTASESFLFTEEQVKALPISPRLFIDISVPRNVAPSVSEIEGIQLYNVDDLKQVVASNTEDRLQKAKEAEAIIAQEVEQFEAWKYSLEAVPTIKKLRASAERIRTSELEKCFAKLGNGIPEKEKKAIHDLSNGIVNKLLNGPMQHLRCDKADPQSLKETLENMNALNRMFSLDTIISQLEEKVRSKIERSKKAVP